MKKLPTVFAEKAYDVLMKFAEASPNYYDREIFIFHFSVVKDAADTFQLSCLDSAKRIFVCNENGEMKLVGKGSDRVNPILAKISRELRGEIEFEEFIIRKS